MDWPRGSYRRSHSIRLAYEATRSLTTWPDLTIPCHDLNMRPERTLLSLSLSVHDTPYTQTLIIKLRTNCNTSFIYSSTKENRRQPHLPTSLLPHTTIHTLTWLTNHVPELTLLIDNWAGSSHPVTPLPGMSVCLSVLYLNSKGNTILCFVSCSQVTTNTLDSRKKMHHIFFQFYLILRDYRTIVYRPKDKVG